MEENLYNLIIDLPKDSDKANQELRWEFHFQQQPWKRWNEN